MNNTTYKAVIDDEKCIGCGDCIAVCFEHAIKMKPGFRSYVMTERCIG